jgi:dGTPase
MYIPSENKKTLSYREELENLELLYLCENAALSVNASRKTVEEKCPFRTEFMRDRDRILHSSAFRRLKHKTQVFINETNDHFRDRLTHTLEVSQIARTMSKVLRLSEDLTEAIALGHDIGHSPFGHSGEEVLNQICPHGFKHYEQSVRTLEHICHDGKGLNLTKETLSGIAEHTTGTATTLEGQIVRLADTIAYINHDIEDAMRAGIIKKQDLPYPLTEALGKTKSARITTLISSVIKNFEAKKTIDFEPRIRRAHDDLREFMFEKVYFNPIVKKNENKAKYIIEKLYNYFKRNPKDMPILYQQIAKNTDLDRAVCDYVSGFTDRFALDLFKEIFIIKIN